MGFSPDQNKWYPSTASPDALKKRVEENPLREQRYADDTVLFAKDKATSELQVQKLKSVGARWGMIFNDDKTEIVSRYKRCDQKTAVLLGALVAVNGATSPNVRAASRGVILLVL